VFLIAYLWHVCRRGNDLGVVMGGECGGHDIVSGVRGAIVVVTSFLVSLLIVKMVPADLLCVF
jgi:hypothetical protein